SAVVDHVFPSGDLVYIHRHTFDASSQLRQRETKSVGASKNSAFCCRCCDFLFRSDHHCCIDCRGCAAERTRSASDVLIFLGNILPFLLRTVPGQSALLHSPDSVPWTLCTGLFEMGIGAILHFSAMVSVVSFDCTGNFFHRLLCEQPVLLSTNSRRKPAH